LPDVASGLSARFRLRSITVEFFVVVVVVVVVVLELFCFGFALLRSVIG